MTRIPKPGSHVRGSRSGKPVMVLLDLLGRRWALRILWELRAERLSFRALRERCGNPSPSVLNDRLRELRENALIDLVEAEGYGLTQHGAELSQHLLPLTQWAERWAKHANRR
jgi:DNA-binding HxlR family transcriptional regulator